MTGISRQGVQKRVPLRGSTHGVSTRSGDGANPSARARSAVDHAACRPDGMRPTAGVDTPYGLVYDTDGRELMGDFNRRIIGYFTSWRTGTKGQPSYLVSDIPWDKITHINYAFAHIEDHQLSLGDLNNPDNPHTGLVFPGQDPVLPYQGHLNLLTTMKRNHPHVKTLISVGGWAESGGYFGPDGTYIQNGGFYKLTIKDDNTTINQEAIDTFAASAVEFLRLYGFDGLDIDHEYATSMPDMGTAVDWDMVAPMRAVLMAGHVALMKALREKLDEAAAEDQKYYLLTIASAGSGVALRGQETYQVTQYLDYINIMTYDFHGAWNHFVGPHNALFDDGRDAELTYWEVYSTPEYGEIGFLNADWAYHYFRAAVPAGRLNLGVGAYTRGWIADDAGVGNGLWARSVGPPPGSEPTDDCPKGMNPDVSCGSGAVGIDNIWHDTGSRGKEIAAGATPMWHAENLRQGTPGSYLATYVDDPDAPENQLVGTYTEHYDNDGEFSWLWNAEKRVFLSTENETSLAAKTNYVVDRGIGGLMMWEFAGDYEYYPDRDNGAGGLGEFFIGDRMVSLMSSKLKNASKYGNRKSNSPMPTAELDVTVTAHGFPAGYDNYPIGGSAGVLVAVANNSDVTIPAGAKLQADIGVSTPPTLVSDWAPVPTWVSQDHTGPNKGGFRGDFRRIQWILENPIAPGTVIDLKMKVWQPFSGPGNWTIEFGGEQYRLTFENHRAGDADPCDAAAWLADAAYRTGDIVTHNDKAWRATAAVPEGDAPPGLAWTQIGSCDPQPGNPCGGATWTPNRVYLQGWAVTHHGHTWEADSWVNVEPAEGTGWIDRGACQGTPRPVDCTAVAEWNPSLTYEQGSLVKHEGLRYGAGNRVGSGVTPTPDETQWTPLGTCQSAF